DPDAHALRRRRTLADSGGGRYGYRWGAVLLASISETFVNETSHFIGEAGLPAIFVLMALSCACIPIPSEVVMLFAGFAVADPAAAGVHHTLTLAGIVLAGLAGTMVGSWIAYAVGRGGGIELFERHGA